MYVPLYLELQEDLVFFLEGMAAFAPPRASVGDQAEQLQREVLHVVELLQQGVHVARGSLKHAGGGGERGSMVVGSHGVCTYMLHTWNRRMVMPVSCACVWVFVLSTLAPVYTVRVTEYTFDVQCTSRRSHR